MMGRLKSGQRQLFYEFHLSDAVPEDRLNHSDRGVTGIYARWHMFEEKREAAAPAMMERFEF
jgi:hypothetical protein